MLIFIEDGIGRIVSPIYRTNSAYLRRAIKKYAPDKVYQRDADDPSLPYFWTFKEWVEWKIRQAYVECKCQRISDAYPGYFINVCGMPHPALAVSR